MAKNIEPKLMLISEYLKLASDEIFVIPEYQRGYSWKIQQCDELWQDIEIFIEKGADTNSDPYFFGTIIIDCSNDDNSDNINEFRLIDGQQRTTTFFLLLKALQIRLQETIKNFKRDEDSEALEEGLKENRNTIINILYKADVEKRIEILKDWDKNAKGILLINNKSNNEKENYKKDFRKIIESENFDEAEKLVDKNDKKRKDNRYTNFFRNFKFFYDKLIDYKESKLNNFAKVFLGKCQVIAIKSWNFEQAITMFNSLNSKGMPLSDADIISAQLYSNSTDKEKFNEEWKSIINLTSTLEKQKIIDIDDVLQQFMYINRAINREYISDNNSTDVTTPGLRSYYTIIKKDLLNSPLDLCEKFQNIIDIWQYIKSKPIIKLLLKFNENVKLYLISYLNRYNAGEINDTIKETEIIQISECLLRLFTILELVDTGFSSKNFKTFLFRENIKLVDTNVPISEIITDFNNHISNMSKNYSKEDIRTSLLDYDKNILVLLNEYLYAKAKNLKFDFAENVNIEHIMPASGRNIPSIMKDAQISSKEEFNSIVNKLGNKILLEEDINKSIGNEWFRTKKISSIYTKTGYKDSKYNIAQSLINFPNDKWTKNDIKNTTDKIADRIIKFIFNN